MSLNEMNLRLADLAGTEILAGAAQGLSILGRLLQRTSTINQPTLVILDMEGIRAATVSCLRECIIGFKSHCRRAKSHLYPVVANPNDLVREELLVALEARGDAITIVESAPLFEARKARVLGQLDPIQSKTLSLIVQHGRVDAATLSKVDETTRLTAWHNRLATLDEKGLLLSNREGRSTYYRALPEVVAHGA